MVLHQNYICSSPFTKKLPYYSSIILITSKMDLLYSKNYASIIGTSLFLVICIHHHAIWHAHQNM